MCLRVFCLCFTVRDGVWIVCICVVAFVCGCFLLCDTCVCFVRDVLCDVVGCVFGCVVGVCLFLLFQLFFLCVLLVMYDVMLCGLCCVLTVLVRVMTLVLNVFVWLGCDLLRDDVLFVCFFLLLLPCVRFVDVFFVGCVCAVCLWCVV